MGQSASNKKSLDTPNGTVIKTQRAGDPPPHANAEDDVWALTMIAMQAIKSSNQSACHEIGVLGGTHGTTPPNVEIANKHCLGHGRGDELRGQEA